MRIQELSERTGVTVRNIRRYTHLGMLSRPVGKTRYASYTSQHIAELHDIQATLAREQSFGIARDVILARRKLTPVVVEPETPPSNDYLTIGCDNAIVTFMPGQRMDDVEQDEMRVAINEAIRKVRRRRSRSSAAQSIESTVQNAASSS